MCESVETYELSASGILGGTVLRTAKQSRQSERCERRCYESEQGRAERTATSFIVDTRWLRAYLARVRTPASSKYGLVCILCVFLSCTVAVVGENSQSFAYKVALRT